MADLKKVRFLTAASGPMGSWKAGQVADIDPSFATALIAGHFAELVEAGPKVQSTSDEKPVIETTAGPTRAVESTDGAAPIPPPRPEPRRPGRMGRPRG